MMQLTEPLAETPTVLEWPINAILFCYLGPFCLNRTSVHHPTLIASFREPYAEYLMDWVILKNQLRLGVLQFLECPFHILLPTPYRRNGERKRCKVRHAEVQRA